MNTQSSEKCHVKLEERTFGRNPQLQQIHKMKTVCVPNHYLSTLLVFLFMNPEYIFVNRRTREHKRHIYETTSTLIVIKIITSKHHLRQCGKII